MATILTIILSLGLAWVLRLLKAAKKNAEEYKMLYEEEKKINKLLSNTFSNSLLNTATPATTQESK